MNNLGRSVIGSGLSRKLSILFSIEGMVELLGLKTWESCCLCASAFFLSFIARLPSGFLIGNDNVLIVKIFQGVFHREPSFSDKRLVCLEKSSERYFAITLLSNVHK